jgi:preprotein translocase subunit SecA
MQLRGRSGRQGDPGESRFHISLEDDLFVRNGFSDLLPERLRMRMRNGISVWGDPAFTRAFDAGQKLVEGYHEDIRHSLAKYAEMPEQQRLMVRRARMTVLGGGMPEPSAENLLPDLYGACVTASGRETVTKFERHLWLTLLDKCWADYLEEVASIREGVHLAAFGHINPVDVFHKEIISLFEAMWQQLGKEMTKWFAGMVTEDGRISDIAQGPSRPAATWTYLILDTPDQFSRLPELVKATTAAVSAPMLALLAWYDRWKAGRMVRRELKEQKGKKRHKEVKHKEAMLLDKTDRGR